jgi:hypothetical protein
VKDQVKQEVHRVMKRRKIYDTILANLREFFCEFFRENICFPESFREIYWKIKICEAVQILFLLLQCEKCVRTGLPKPGS